MNNIKPGYLLKIVTWENDADNYKTFEVDGLTKDEVEFYIAVAKLFRSKNSRLESGFGNEKVPRYDNQEQSEVANYIDEIIEKFQSQGKSIPEYWDKTKEDPEWLNEHGNTFYDDPIYDMIGTWNEGEYYRVFDSFSVVEVPETGLKDVTEMFK